MAEEIAPTDATAAAPQALQIRCRVASVVKAQVMGQDIQAVALTAADGQNIADLLTPGAVVTLTG